MILDIVLILTAATQDTSSRNTFGVWDTGRPSGEPLAAVSSDWIRIAQSDKPAAFQGDAVLANGRVMALARKSGSALELYTLGSGSPLLRARLHVERSPIQRFALVENGRASVALEIGWKNAAARFRLKRGELFVETEALSGDALHVECPGRFVVLPDFFADDILVDARKVPLDKVELPSENFVLHLTGKQDAMAMCVFENRDQDVRVTLSGRGDARAIVGSEIQFGKGRRIWVAALEAPGLWHTVDLGPADAKKIIPLEWKMPFVAQWRVDFTRKEDLTDSWDMLLQDKEGADYIKPSCLKTDGQISDPSRTSSGEVDLEAYQPGGVASQRLGAQRVRFTTVLLDFNYPCWSDPERKGYLQPLDHRRLSFRGPVVIYPIGRLAQTPIESYTPIDIMRSTLGVGPCQYVLDVEGQKQEHVGRATCHVRALLNETYAAGQQKARRKEIENYLGDALDFVTHIRNRVQAYVDFGKEMRRYLAEQREAHPELKDPIAAMEALTQEIDTRVDAQLKGIKVHKNLQELLGRAADTTTPGLVRQLNGEFLKNLIDYGGADWKDRLKKEYTDPLTAIGGLQEAIVGECRWVVKALRQKAGLSLTAEPKMAAVAAEIRARTHKILRGANVYEGARH